MKTLRILPWYFLLLIIGLCAAMSTREGMTVKHVDDDATVDSVVQFLKDKFNESVSKKDLRLIVVSDKITTYHGTKHDIILKSKNDTKTNLILSKISKGYLDGDTMILIANKKYEPYMYSNEMFIPAS
jgi:hypothetical protein